MMEGLLIARKNRSLGGKDAWIIQSANFDNHRIWPRRANAADSGPTILTEIPLNWCL